MEKFYFKCNECGCIMDKNDMFCNIHNQEELFCPHCFSNKVSVTTCNPLSLVYEIDEDDYDFYEENFDFIF